MSESHWKGRNHNSRLHISGVKLHTYVNGAEQCLVLGAHWSNFFSCVCQPVLQALTALKQALLSLLEQHSLSGEQQKVRASLGIELYLAACWGRIRSGTGEMKTEPCFSPTICSRGHFVGASEPSSQIKMKVGQYHFIIWQDFLINDGYLAYLNTGESLAWN